MALEAPRIGFMPRLPADNVRVHSGPNRLTDRARPGAMTGDLTNVFDSRLAAVRCLERSQVVSLPPTFHLGSAEKYSKRVAGALASHDKVDCLL
jgi:hypothetical protein